MTNKLTEQEEDVTPFKNQNGRTIQMHRMHVFQAVQMSVSPSDCATAVRTGVHAKLL